MVQVTTRVAEGRDLLAAALARQAKTQRPWADC
jgi:hypothetical protein